MENKTKHYIIKSFLLSQVLAFSWQGQAQVCSTFNMERTNVGFFLSSKQQQVLLTKQLKESNKGLTSEAKAQRVKKHIAKYRNEIPEISNDSLAKNIVRAADAVGLDFSILSSVVRKESIYCKSRHNKTGGDSGCMQFTSAGLTELKHQFGLAGPKHNAAGVPKILQSFVAKYYLGKPDREKEFYRLLKSAIPLQRLALRGSSVIDADLLFGAILLKVYLSSSNGNYIAALRQYNSSAKKIAYANDANAVASNINYHNVQCLVSAEAADRILLESCEIDNDVNCFLNEDSFSLPILGPGVNMTKNFKMESPLKFPMASKAKILKRFAEKEAL